MTQLTQSQHLALKHLEIKRPEFVSPTEVGRKVGKQLGKKRSWALRCGD